MTSSNRATVYDRVFDWAEHECFSALTNGSDNETLADGTVFRCYASNFCIGFRNGQFLTYDGRQVAPAGSEAELCGIAASKGF